MKKERTIEVLLIAALIILTNTFYLILHIIKNSLIYRSLLVNAISPMSSMFPFGNYLVPFLAIYNGYQILLLRNRWRIVFIVYQFSIAAFVLLMSFSSSTLTLNALVKGVMPTLFIFLILPVAYIYYLTRPSVKKQFK